MTPDRPLVTFTIDGLEVKAPEGEWLVDAAKRGDVEIPYFCYERKLGQPVGACRMCMVEIEGLPKLQVSCATPVKDGMVVYTQTDRVKHAQNAVVEFLLVNHPLDCPVCDKGGECPLQDISYGWGPGRSRFTEPKRNFPKPIALSPLVAIDRERCILCYRCVRFSQEVSEDDQLVFLERADHTFVGTFDGQPYVAPFSGNVIELCPVGALTSTPYRFRARPWEIENSGSVCALCPSQCNIAFTVRDDRVERVLDREHPEVDDGWLCDKGRFGYQAIHSDERITSPLIRDGGRLRPVSWERALEAAAAGLGKAGASSAAVVGGSTTNEEGYLLQRLFRQGLGSPNVDSRASGLVEPETVRLLARPELTARTSDIDRAGVVLVLACDPMNEMPILDLRVRKAVRRHGARLVVASAFPTALDGGASELLQYPPGAEEALLRALQKAMLAVDEPVADTAESATTATKAAEDGEAGDAAAAALPGQAELVRFLQDRSLGDLAAAAGVAEQDLRDAARLLVGAESIVVLWGERLGSGSGGGALRALTDLAMLAGMDGGADSGLIEVPAGTNARGLREVGCVPNLGPGLSDPPADASPGMTAAEAAAAAARGELRALYLLHADPVRDRPGSELWEQALDAAGFVVAHEQFMTESVERHADIVFPAESYAEKEGTVTHPDGRLQRLRRAIGHPAEVRPEWQVLVELSGRLGAPLEIPIPHSHATAAVMAEIEASVPLYRGMTPDVIGARGLRWPEHPPAREAADAVLGPLRFGTPRDPVVVPKASDGSLLLVPVPSLWASWETERSPVLKFLKPSQVLQLHPTDAARLGVGHGDEVVVSSNGNSVRAVVVVRESARAGSAYLIAGTSEHNPYVLTEGPPVVVEVKMEEAAAAVS